MAAFLDLETARDGRITVVGYATTAGPGVFHLVLGRASREDQRGALLAACYPRCRLYTFNGHAFDLRLLRERWGVDLRARCDSVDLMWACRREGIRGTQKHVERYLHGRAGRDVPPRVPPNTYDLWARWERGDAAALAELLEYNFRDVEGLRQIRDALLQRGALPGCYQ